MCATGHANGDIINAVSFPTTSPRDCLDKAVTFFREHRVTSVGIGSFGPVSVRPDATDHGHITSTPKPGWQGIDVVSPIREALQVPVALDTDVNAAALAEWLWGAGRGAEVLAYLTVGTGIGAGIAINGGLLHGFMHPEFGHIRIPHDLERDPFGGCCPFHGDCLEGLASGASLRKRYGVASEDLDDAKLGGCRRII